MISPDKISEIYHEMYRYYPVRRDELPVGFTHRKLMDLGKYRVQGTYAGCGRWMTIVGMKVQKIEFKPRSPSQMEWLRDIVPTHFSGIDPQPLVEGMKSAGVECTAHRNADEEMLVELLRACPSVCILAIQAPWCRLEEINNMDAGHYVAAGHVDLRKNEVLVHDTGNGSPWGRIKLKHLPYIWHDHIIGRKKRVFEGWMLHIPVKS